MQQNIKKICVMLVITVLTASFVVALGMRTFAAKGGNGIPTFQGETPVDETSVEMIINGQTQGTIQGEGPDGTIIVYDLIHKLNQSYNSDNGLPSGKRVHNPLLITKAIDKSSPQLFQAFCQNETLAITINWYRLDPSDSKTWQQYYTMTLQDAKIVVMKEWDVSSPQIFSTNTLPTEEVSLSARYTNRPSTGEPTVNPNTITMKGDAASPKLYNYIHMEEVCFTYQSISWTYNIGTSITFGDQWNQNPTK
jgi:type VI secretion system Hcp family effector